MFKNIFSFNGRIRRTEFGISYIVSFVLASIFFFHVSIISLFFLVPTLWFVLAQGTKRCHDLGKSGWWQIIPFYVLWLLFQDGDPNENEYGDNPKGNILYTTEDYQEPFGATVYSDADVTADIIDDAVMIDLLANEQQAANDSAYIATDNNTSSDWDNSDSSADSSSYDSSDSSSSDDGMDSF
jgi:hypothetical protein